MNPTMLKDISPAEIGAPVAAASDTDDNSDIIDMAGFEGCIFLVAITDSANTGVGALTIEQNSANSASGMAALSGAAATATSAEDDDLNGKFLVVDVYRPRERYLQAVRTSLVANIAFGNVFAIRYGGRKFPKSDDATVAASAHVSSPAEA